LPSRCAASAPPSRNSPRPCPSSVTSRAASSSAASAAFQSPISTTLSHHARRSPARRVERAIFSRPAAPSIRRTTSRNHC
jgi:hypothetical protein